MLHPRKQWPTEGEAGRRGRIPEAVRLQPGRALSIWGDAGWGQQMRSFDPCMSCATHVYRPGQSPVTIPVVG